MYSNLSEEWKLFVPIHKTSDVSTTAYNSSVVTQTIPETNPADSSSFGSRMKEYTVATLNEIAHQVEAQHSADLEDLDICDYGMELSCIVHKIVDEFRRQCSSILKETSIPDSNEVDIR